MHAVPAASFVEFGHSSPGPACPLCQHPESNNGFAPGTFRNKMNGYPPGGARNVPASSLTCATTPMREGSGRNWWLYAETGAGVEPIAQMVMENLPMQLHAFADVGCGLGYSLDFVEQALGVPAWGRAQPHADDHEFARHAAAPAPGPGLAVTEHPPI